MALFSKTLTIRDLLEIDPGRQERSKDLKVTYVSTQNVLIPMKFFDRVLKIITGKTRLLYAKIVRYSVQSDSGNTYTVLIKVSPGFDTKQFYKQKVEVFCTCSDFKYRAAYNLNKFNNLVKIKATIDHLGIALTQKPTRVATTPICKHIYACLDHFKANMKNLKLVYQ